MLPTPLILSMILSLPALSAALPIHPEPRALHIVDDAPFTAHSSLARRSFDAADEDEIPADSLYSPAEDANADWDALRLARRTGKQAAAPVPTPSVAGKKAKRSGKAGKKAKRALGVKADLSHIIAANVNDAVGPSTVTITADTPTTTLVATTVLAYSLVSAGATISPLATALPLLSTLTAPTAAPTNTGVARGPNAQASNPAAVSSLVSAWSADAVHEQFYDDLLKAEPTVAANGAAYDGKDTTATGWEILGQHRAATVMYMEAGVGACGGKYSDNSPVVALSHALFKNWPGATSNINYSPLCGRRVQIEANGVIVQARVGDSHEGAQSDLVVTKSIFEKFGELEEGIIENAIWSFI